MAPHSSRTVHLRSIALKGDLKTSYLVNLSVKISWPNTRTALKMGEAGSGKACGWWMMFPIEMKLLHHSTCWETGKRKYAPPHRPAAPELPMFAPGPQNTACLTNDHFVLLQATYHIGKELLKNIFKIIIKDQYLVSKGTCNLKPNNKDSKTSLQSLPILWKIQLKILSQEGS